MASPLLSVGHAAFQRGDWAEAHEALTVACGEGPPRPDDLRLLAIAAFLVGDETGFMGALQGAHQAAGEAGDAAGAARDAFWIGFHLANRGELARANGWFARCSRWAERAGEDCAERACLLLPRAVHCVGTGEFETAARVAGECAAIAERHADNDLLALALHVQGRALLRQERVAEGLRLLDEAMVSVTTGELSPQVTGLVYCGVIGACREVWALGRAHEWTAALAEWCAAQPDIVPYAGECRVYRAEVLQFHGEWTTAMDEAVGARDAFEHGSTPGGVGLAWYRIAELHRLRGDYTAAEEAYQAANLSGREPQPGLALLRLAEGRAAAAEATLSRSLAETSDPLRRARLLPAYLETLTEAGAIEAAHAACVELAEIARRFSAGTLTTLAEQMEGAIALAEGDPETAVGPLRSALRSWRETDAPYDEARTRVLLGLACRSLGDMDGAALEFEAARAAFERMGATPDVAKVDALLRGRPRGNAYGLTPRELEVLQQLATGRTNRAIAERLFISEKTVARHVANIFAKIGVSTRAAATAFAYENDLA